MNKLNSLALYLIIDAHNHTHSYINFGQSLTLHFFFLNFTNFITKSYYNMITIHTHVINPLYFLIIKPYKIILYLYCTHKYPLTSLFTQMKL